MQDLVNMQGIVKSFPGVMALSGASLELKNGEVLGLLGENGAGKSTLMNILGGIHKPDAGSIAISGNVVKINCVEDARTAGVAFIHQEIALVPQITVAENIYLGRELMTAGMLDQNKMIREAKQWLDMVGLQINPKCYVSELSIAQQQMVEIAKACSFNMKILIMDEPTSSLSEKEVDTFFRVIQTLKEKGIGIIYISHKLSELFEITDRICVMRDGKTIGTVNTADITQDELVAMMVGRKLENYYTRTYNPRGEKVLEVRNVSCGKQVHNCSFDVYSGEILGFYGLVGAGRSELLEAVMGIYRKEEGTVVFLGEDISKMSAMKIQKKGMALVPEDRKTQGLILKQTISANIALPILDQFLRCLHLDVKKRTQIIDRQIHDLSIKTPSRDQLARNLSGGNQQKVVLGKWLAVRPKLLIIDEPTRGIDVGSKAEIYSIMNELAAQGMAIVMISSEMPEIMNMCDRVMIMNNGRIKGELRMDEFDQQRILHYAVSEDENDEEQ